MSRTRPKRQAVRERARGTCEYCRLPDSLAAVLDFHVEHVRPRQHGGTDELENLAFACLWCNLKKGPNLAGISHSGQLVRLYNPRTDEWAEHFEWQGTTLFGLTEIGQATVTVLDINGEEQVSLREQLLLEGLFPYLH